MNLKLVVVLFLFFIIFLVMNTTLGSAITLNLRMRFIIPTTEVTQVCLREKYGIDKEKVGLEKNCIKDKFTFNKKW